MLLCLSVTAAYGLAGEVLQMLTNQCATYVQLDGFSCRCGRGFGRITRSGSRKSEDGLLISFRFPYSHGSLSGKISYLCTID